jgi:flagellum-specific peptidoglycan hydrolase FlgJ
MTTPIRIEDVVKHYKGLPNQKAALAKLQEVLDQLRLTHPTQDWVKLWRTPNPAPKPAQKKAFSNTWEGIEAAAAAAGAKFPELVAAQWALESAYGKHLSGKNNYFGIKGTGTVKTTWEDYGYGPVTIKASFKDFATPYDCVNELVTKWYKDYKGYRGVNRAASREEAARLLKAEGYATDPVYADKLIRLMMQHD